MSIPAILVVDDEYNTRMGVSYTLQQWGDGKIDIAAAENGQQALNMLREREYDLLITDIRMPLMTGIELLEALRREKNEIAAVLLTGFAEFEYAQQGLRLGAIDYLLKPVQQSELIKMAEKALNKARLAKERRKRLQQHFGQLELGEAAAANGWQGQTSQNQDPLSLRTSNEYVIKAVQYIDGHISNVLTIKEVAQQVHLNPSYFSVLFKEEAGLTFIDYVTRLRMKKAKELLESSSLSLDAISEQIGLQTTSYFIRMFKKFERMTPKQYRDQVKIKS
ncbi:response regulator [Paenibacillus sp. FSL W8-0186]|uniref:DNA-binding response regulator n=1 Tax=Paenibacillus woosongensis TaxID=307580 RepID=A0ABQ4MXA4_9BACL|nr:response regulator [Paenibacillus woosongensis]GIP60554.1 DNA-binding response regulator [Paenibacillus woosongensis]